MDRSPGDIPSLHGEIHTALNGGGERVGARSGRCFLAILAQHLVAAETERRTDGVPELCSMGG
ncbi:MAG: hypothetical protein NZ578_06145 [Candidatus Binatia bacterium]|nr:hypothetical protein [Candidatus Binatia bacterium]